MQRRFITICIIVSVVLPSLTYASASKFNLVGEYPSLSSYSFFYADTTEQLSKLSFLFGSMFSYGYEPLKVYRSNIRVQDGMNHLFVEHFYTGLGITSWWQLGLDLPVAWFYQYGNVDTLRSDIKTNAAISDLQISNKITFLNKKDKIVGLGINACFNLPTGKSADFLGDTYPVGAIKAIADKDISKHFGITLNIGSEFRQQVDSNNISFGNRFLLGGGVDIKPVDNFSVLIEGDVKTPFNDFFKTSNSTPAILVAGLGWRPKKAPLNVKVGGLWGISSGSGAPEWGSMLGVNYIYRKKDRKVKTSDVTKPIVKKFVVHFDFDRTVIVDNEAGKLGDIVEILINQDFKRIEINGHADIVGDKVYNHNLSKKRANKVWECIMKRSPEYLSNIKPTIKSFGETQFTGQGNKYDRRVEIIILQ